MPEPNYEDHYVNWKRWNSGPSSPLMTPAKQPVGAASSLAPLDTPMEPGHSSSSIQRKYPALANWLAASKISSAQTLARSAATGRSSPDAARAPLHRIAPVLHAYLRPVDRENSRRRQRTRVRHASRRPFVGGRLHSHATQTHAGSLEISVALIQRVVFQPGHGNRDVGGENPLRQRTEIVTNTQEDWVYAIDDPELKLGAPG